jgi:hypothetical protein
MPLEFEIYISQFGLGKCVYLDIGYLRVLPVLPWEIHVPSSRHRLSCTD